MAPENRRPRLYTGAFLAGLYLVSLLARLPLIFYPPTDYYYNFDELSVTYVALDRFLGLPSTLLMLPASLLQFNQGGQLFGRGAGHAQTRAATISSSLFNTPLTSAVTAARRRIILFD